jgi:hypothetical protein
VIVFLGLSAAGFVFLLNDELWIGEVFFLLSLVFAFSWWLVTRRGWLR